MNNKPKAPATIGLMTNMPHFFVIGFSHHQAPVAVRERFSAIASPEPLYALEASGDALDEFLVLSTCNRLEMLAVSRNASQGREALLEALSSVSGLPLDEFSPYMHEYSGLEAARYIFRIASSLDSMILGEPQILGQVKDAFHKALACNRAGFLLTKLMHRCFRSAKRVRSETSLAGGAVSVAGAAVTLAKSLEGGDLKNKSVLVLGAGPMASLALANLKKRSPAQITVINRTLSKAEALAAKHGALCRPWEELLSAILEADIILAATCAQNPILTYEKLEKIMAVRGRHLIIIDIGVPRNAAHDLKYLDRVILRNIDDLNEVVWEGRAARQSASLKAEEIIEEEVIKFGDWLKSLTNQPLVAALTKKAEHIRRMELNRTFKEQHFSPEQAASIEAMTSALVRRLLHDPLNFIKKSPAPCAPEKDGCQNGENCLHSIRQAFKIEPQSDNGYGS